MYFGSCSRRNSMSRSIDPNVDFPYRFWSGSRALSGIKSKVTVESNFVPSARLENAQLRAAWRDLLTGWDGSRIFFALWSYEKWQRALRLRRLQRPDVNARFSDFTRPLVSILIPCYNAERWIAHAIESALAQTWPNKQIIVLDDGSTDGSLNVIRQYENRLHWETGQNRGGGYARNRLLELASAEWIQYLDADDYLLPDKVAHQAKFVNEYPDIDVVLGPTTMEFWSEEGAKRELISIPEPHDFWTMLASWTLPQTGAPLWRRSAILDVGGWKRDQPCCQEHELYLRLLIGGMKFACHSSGGSIYRQWSDQTVCKRDISEVHRRRLEIERNLQEFLRKTDS